MEKNIFETGFRVTACEGGSFVVSVDAFSATFLIEAGGHFESKCERRAFTGLGDLMAWLGLQAGEARPSGRQLPDTIKLNRESLNIGTNTGA